MRRVRLSVLNQVARRRPRAYLEDFMGAGRVDGHDLVLDDRTWERLHSKWRQPTFGELVSNFAGAVRRVARLGFKVVTKEEFDLRSSTCIKCDYVLPAGGCYKCGCCRLKMHLATEKCPLGLWQYRLEKPNPLG